MYFTKQLCCDSMFSATVQWPHSTPCNIKQSSKTTSVNFDAIICALCFVSAKKSISWLIGLSWDRFITFMPSLCSERERQREREREWGGGGGGEREREREREIERHTPWQLQPWFDHLPWHHSSLYFCVEFSSPSSSFFWFLFSSVSSWFQDCLVLLIYACSRGDWYCALGEIHQISVHLQIQTSRHGRSVLLSSMFFVSFFFSKQQCQQAQVNTKCQKNSSSSWHITDCVVFHSSQVKIDTHVFSKAQFILWQLSHREGRNCHKLIGTGLNSFLYVLFLCLESIMCFFSFSQKKINAGRFPFQCMSVLFSRAQMSQKSMRVENKKHWQHAQA